jgi:uncharacterized protein (TIGR03067 family)
VADLLGEWELSYMQGGGEFPLLAVAGAGEPLVRFTESKCVFVAQSGKSGAELAPSTNPNGPPTECHASYTLDPSADPKQMDLRVGQEIARCIYQVDRKRLRLCVGSSGMGRPTEFAPGEHQTVMDLYRVTRRKR